MTINWFTSAPSTLSGEAKQILRLLGERAKVIVWSNDVPQPDRIEGLVDLHFYDPNAIPWAEMNLADVTIFHLNNQSTSNEIWQVNRERPGIMILDDLAMQPFFAGLLAKALISPEEYLQMMEFHHGEEGRELAEELLAGRKSVEEVSESCPLTGAILEQATGIGVHSEESRAFLARTTDVPVAYLPLDQAEDYVDALMQLIRIAIESRSREAAFWMSGRAGKVMRPWFDDEAADILLPRLADTIGHVFGGVTR